MTAYLDPKTLYPINNIKRTVFLKNIVTNPHIIIGDYTYYDDPDDAHNFEKNVLYLFDFLEDKLIIGKFCQIASGVRFIMNGANHPIDGISTYPFKVFGKAWEHAPLSSVNKGNTIIENDVWIGNSVTFMPGIHVGSGSIIAANSVVTKNIEPYTIVGGNPAKEIRKRFNHQQINFLLQLAWWDWPVDKINHHLNAIVTGDFDHLKTIVTNHFK